MAFPQQHEVHFPENVSHAADAPQSDIAFPAYRHRQLAPTPYPRPLLGQPHGHVGELQDAVLPSANAAGSRQPNEDRIKFPPPVENQAQPQDQQYIDMNNYGMSDDSALPQGHHVHIISDNAGVIQGVPAQVQDAPPAPAIDAFNGEVQQAATGPAPIFDEFLDQGPVPNRRASEILRQLAILYLNDPNSQLEMIRMEPADADGVIVVITLKLTNL